MPSVNELLQDILETLETGGGHDLPLHFGAYTNDTIAVSTDPDAPTYLTNIALFPSSSPDDQAAEATKWLTLPGTSKPMGFILLAGDRIDRQQRSHHVDI